jgi:hypothetical protein
MAVVERGSLRFERVSAGLDELDRWLRDQIRGGLAGLERDGPSQAHAVAARMVDAQAPGVASVLRALVGDLATDDWPTRVLDRLAALHLLIEAHRRITLLPAELAATVRSRIGYPVAKADVLAGPGVRDRWMVLGSVDTIESQLQTRRVWLYGSQTRRWALWLSFAGPGMSLDTSIRPGQLVDSELHFYPGSGFRVLLGNRHDTAEFTGSDYAGWLRGETFAEAQRRNARLLAADPWSTRMPAVLSAAPVQPTAPDKPWRLRDAAGNGVELVGVAGDPWPIVARSAGEPIDIFGEWGGPVFRPLSLLPQPGNAWLATELV